MATREAVTLFVKSGTESEVVDATRRDADDANVRLNTMFARKYYVAALTDATKAVEISIPYTPSVKIVTPDPTIGVGDTVQMKAQGSAAGTIGWTSGTTGKATVNATSGLVTGVSAGTAQITATLTVGGSTYTDTAVVTVE